MSSVSSARFVCVAKPSKFDPISARVLFNKRLPSLKAKFDAFGSDFWERWKFTRSEDLRRPEDIAICKVRYQEIYPLVRSLVGLLYEKAPRVGVKDGAIWNIGIVYEWTMFCDKKTPISIRLAKNKRDIEIWSPDRRIHMILTAERPYFDEDSFVTFGAIEAVMDSILKYSSQPQKYLAELNPEIAEYYRNFRSTEKVFFPSECLKDRKYSFDQTKGLTDEELSHFDALKFLHILLGLYNSICNRVATDASVKNGGVYTEERALYNQSSYLNAVFADQYPHDKVYKASQYIEGERAIFDPKRFRASISEIFANKRIDLRRYWELIGMPSEEGEGNILELADDDNRHVVDVVRNGFRFYPVKTPNGYKFFLGSGVDFSYESGSYLIGCEYLMTLGIPMTFDKREIDKLRTSYPYPARAPKDQFFVPKESLPDYAIKSSLIA